MKVVLLLSLLVVAATAAPKDKRFLIKDITNWWHDVWNKAKNEFNHIVDGIHGIDFDAVVQKLIPLIDSSMTKTACSSVCVGAAATVLGPAAVVADAACSPLCDAALKKLESMAG